VLVEAIDTVAREGRGGKGTIILFAMNNLDQDDCVGPNPDISSLASVIAVSGASDLDRKVSMSAWGDCMEVLSPTYETDRPGVATTDLTGKRGYNNGRYPGDLADLDYTVGFGGTSAATPIAAGVFALMLAVNDGLSRDEALAIVEATAAKVSPEDAQYDAQTGFSHKYGFGRIDAARAVRAAAAFRKYSRSERGAGPGRTAWQ
jgi:subtilisin family serine protease